MAGIFAFKDAMKKATPILLEPIMGVEVTTPEEYQGDLIRRHQPPPRDDPRTGEQGGRVHHRGDRSPGDPLRLRD